jgi:pseudaminic acid biosynthesis-associated methylase
MQDSFSQNEHQRKIWMGDFGDSYIDRNKNLDKINSQFKELIGYSKEEIFHDFFSSLNHELKVLEVGCNVGLNLSVLKKIGFQNLFGIEINEKAIKIAKEQNPEIEFFHSSIENFETNLKFDLVFTSGVLIHINPKSIPSILQKIYSLSDKFVFGYENFSETLTKLDYRNHSDILWKQNFPELYRNLFPNLTTIKEKIFTYKNDGLQDIAFLFSKR